MNIITAAALLIVAGIASARADCVTPDQVSEGVAAEHPGAIATTITGPAAERLTAQIEAMVGEDQPDGGAYMVFDDPESSKTYVMLILDGCAARHGFFPAQLIRHWLGGQGA